MKTATVEADALRLICPHCGEPVEAPDNGSHMINSATAADMVKWQTGKPSWQCTNFACRCDFYLPVAFIKFAGVLT